MPNLVGRKVNSDLSQDSAIALNALINKYMQQDFNLDAEILRKTMAIDADIYTQTLKVKVKNGRCILHDDALEMGVDCFFSVPLDRNIVLSTCWRVIK